MEWRRYGQMDAYGFEEVWSLYQESFPLHEQRLPVHQSQAMADPRFFCRAAYEGDALQALLFSWRMGKLCYVEHFAVHPALRGSGIGSALLRDFCREEGAVVLEIDPLVDEISRRRKGFYERLGFAANPYSHAHPPYRAGNAPHPLIVMSWPAPLHEAEYAAFFRGLSQEVMAYAEK